MCCRTSRSRSARVGVVAQEGDRRPGEIERAPVVGAHHLHDLRRGERLRAPRAPPPCPIGKRATRDHADRPPHRRSAGGRARPPGCSRSRRSRVNSGRAATSATRSVPDGCCGDVMTHSAPAAAAAAATSGWSVAMTQRSATPSAVTRCQTRMTRGEPARSRSGLRGSRVAPRRAGITASVLTMTRK